MLFPRIVRCLWLLFIKFGKEWWIKLTSRPSFKSSVKVFRTETTVTVSEFLWNSSTLVQHCCRFPSIPFPAHWLSPNGILNPLQCRVILVYRGSAPLGNWWWLPKLLFSIDSNEWRPWIMSTADTHWPQRDRQCHASLGRRAVNYGSIGAKTPTFYGKDHTSTNTPWFHARCRADRKKFISEVSRNATRIVEKNAQHACSTGSNFCRKFSTAHVFFVT